MAIIYRITWLKFIGNTAVHAGYSFHYSLPSCTTFQREIEEKNETLDLSERLFLKNGPDMRETSEDFFDLVKGMSKKALQHGIIVKKDPTKAVFPDQKVPTLETMIRR